MRVAQAVDRDDGNTHRLTVASKRSVGRGIVDRALDEDRLVGRKILH